MKVEDYIKETSQKMQFILENSSELFQDIQRSDFSKIIITGSGTSYHTGVQTKSYLQNLLNVEIEVVYPFMITNDLFKNQKKTLLIGISQGGSSYSTYNAMQVAKENGCLIASMAGEEDALIDEVADYVLTVYCGPEEAGPKTKGYTTTKLNLMLFGLYTAHARRMLSDGEFQGEIDEIKEAINLFAKVYDESKKWVLEHQEDFASAHDIRIIGTSDLYGDVLESALKLLETLRIPVSGYEFEEFVHGIYNAINEKSTIIILDSGREERIDKLIEVLSDWTDNIYIVSNQGVKEHNSLSLEIGENSILKNLLFILPIQLMCAFVPEIKGIDPSIPKDPNFHKKLASKRL